MHHNVYVHYACLYACVNKDVFVIAVNSWFPSFGRRHLIEKMSPQSSRGNMVRRHGQPSTVLRSVYQLRISLMWPNGLTRNGTERCWDVELCANYSFQQQMAFKDILASEIRKCDLCQELKRDHEKFQSLMWNHFAVHFWGSFWPGHGGQRSSSSLRASLLIPIVTLLLKIYSYLLILTQPLTFIHHYMSAFHNKEKLNYQQL